MLPERLGKYAVDSLIGEGGMGSVYAAHDPESGERLALKVLSGGLAEDEVKFLRFEQEVAALSRVDSENIVRLLGPIQRDQDRIFFPMELVEGHTLSQELRQEGPMPVPTTLGIVRPLLDALEAAHGAGVVHRDIKPSNVLLVEDGVKLTDFGLARMDDITRLTQTGQLMGTLDYMSPEQCEGTPVDARTDLYSIGILLFEMLTGDPPFRHESPGAVLKGHLTETPPRADRIRADLPEGLGDVIAKLLEKRPEDRYATAAETNAALARVRDPSVTVTFHPGVKTPKSTPASTVPRRKRRWKPIAVGALILVLLVAVVISQVRRNRRYPGRATMEMALETLHLAIKRGDFRTFTDGFAEGALLEYFPENAEAEFRRRAKNIVDFGYEPEIPRKRPPKGDIYLRVVRGRALPTILGVSSRDPLRVMFRHEPDGFLVMRIAKERGVPPRRGIPAAFEERQRRYLHARVGEVFAKLDELGPHLLARMAKDGRVPRERIEKMKEGLQRLATGGKVGYRILENESTYDTGRVQIVVSSPDLAKALDIPTDRFVAEFARSIRDRTWRLKGGLRLQRR